MSDSPKIDDIKQLAADEELKDVVQGSEFEASNSAEPDAMSLRGPDGEAPDTPAQNEDSAPEPIEEQADKAEKSDEATEVTIVGKAVDWCD